MGCSTTDSTNCQSFLTAAQAASGSMCSNIAFSEIQLLQTAILGAVASCKRQVIVSSGTPMTALDNITAITLTAPGANYFPVVATATITHPSGTGASLTPTISNGTITGFIINAGGSGYAPVVAVADASGTGDGNAVLQTIVNNGKISIVNIIAGGTGYSVGDQIIIVHPNGSGAIVHVATIGTSGRITSTVVNSQGSGYDPIVATITVNHPLGVGFTGTVLVNSGSIIGVTILNPGAGYTTLLPTVLVHTTTGSKAKFALTVNTGTGAITSITIINGGVDYSSSDTVSIIPALTSSGSGATATITVTSGSSSIPAEDYLNTILGTVINPTAQAQLAYVINYFKCLGYNIQAQVNPASGSTMQWFISW
jgi:hypothetical protein